MRKMILLLAVVIAVLLVVVFYPSYVEKPVKDGSGSLAVRIDASYSAPEYHSPIDWWQTHHMDVVNRGDISKSDCVYCHEPQKSCNNCHAYVGANPITEIRPAER